MKKFLLLSLVLATTNALALNLQGYRFSDSYRYSVLDDSLQEKFAGNYVVTASVGYVKNPLFYSNNKTAASRADNIIHQNQIATLGYSRYISNDFSLGLDVNYIMNDVSGKDYSGLADSVAKARYNFYKNDGKSLSLNPQVFIPTGNKNNFTTTRTVGGSLSLVGELATEKWHFLASGGYFSASGNKASVIDYRNLMTSQLGISYDANEKWNINVEAVNTYSTIGEHDQDEGDYYVTFKNKVKDSMSVNFGAGMAGVDEVNRDNYTFFAGIKFHEIE